MAAVNHAGEARGLRKWDARLAADSDSCKVDVRYQWGDGGMKLF